MAKNKNDQAILKLKKDIAAKKAALKAAERFVPITNCSLIINSERFNLHTINDADTITGLMVALNVYKISASDLGLLETFKISGFTVTDWMSDLQVKLTIINRKQEEGRLKKLEDRLHSLLSTDTKVELELSELRSMI